MLPEPIPLEESRAMARRLVEPLWKVVVEKGDDRTKFETLQALVNADPAGVLEKLESAKFADKVWEIRLQTEVAVALAGSDPEEAAAVAESIADPAERAAALIELVDALPATERQRKLALLDRAVLQAKAVPDRPSGSAGSVKWPSGGTSWARSTRPRRSSPRASAWPTRFTDKTEFGGASSPRSSPWSTVPAALAIAKDFEGDRSRSGSSAISALRLIDQNPAEGERFWKEIERVSRGDLSRRSAGRWPAVDPVRARRVIEGFPLDRVRNPNCSCSWPWVRRRGTSPPARQAIDEGLRWDRPAHARAARTSYQFVAGTLLPVVERIDPALVPEVFWRDVASRPPFGNPRTISAYSPSRSDPAPRLVRPRGGRRAVRAESSPDGAHRGPRAGDLGASEFVAWSLFDPRAAVARLEKVPVSPDSGPSANAARLAVATSLGLPYEARWRRIWSYWEVILGGPKRGF